MPVLKHRLNSQRATGPPFQIIEIPLKQNNTKKPGVILSTSVI